MEEKKQILLRVYLIYFGFVLLMAIVIFKSISIITQGRSNVFSSTSEMIKTREAKKEPRRGEILDSKGSPLLTSVSEFDIYFDPVTVDTKDFNAEIENLSIELAKIFPKRNARDWETYLRNAKAKKRRYVLIEKKVKSETRRKLRTLPIFNLGKYKGGLIDNDEKIERKRPNNELLRRTLGYIKIDENGQTTGLGLESAFNSYLAGDTGIFLQQKIPQGWKSTGTIIREAQEGKDIITTIDKDIQEVAHSELLKQLETKGGRYGCAIVMEVETGYIKAMVNLSEENDGKYYESYNHAIGTKEVPGSTFKLASIMAALEDKKIRISDSVNAVGKYEFYGEELNDDNTWGYGTITIQKAFEKSSNVISKVIHQNYTDNPDQFIDRLKSFGLMDTLGISIEGEKKPTMSLPGSSTWWRGSIAWMAIGYEVQQTPLQTLSFYNTVANNGRMMKPQFVSEIRQSDKTVKEFAPVVIKERICSPGTITVLKSCLEGVVEHGTGRALQSSFFKIAGKTGTAKISNDNRGYGAEGEEKYIASFAGYFPADKPIYSCIVVIAAPTKDIYGASVSGTVFAAIANKVYATSLQYQPAINESPIQKSVPISQNGSKYDLDQILRTLNIKTTGNSNKSFVKTQATSDGVSISDQFISKKTVPNVTGMGLKDAVYVLEETGLKVRTKGYGSVSSQSIKPGTPAVKGGIIQIELK